MPTYEELVREWNFDGRKTDILAALRSIVN
jgi:hypothetical protein